MHKIDLLDYAAHLDGFTSHDLADAFDLPLSTAAAYLTKAHGRGYLQRFKVGRAFNYSLSTAGLRHLRYWLSRAAAEDHPEEPDDDEDFDDDADLDDDENFDDGDDVDDDAPPDLVTLFCPRCRRAFRFTGAEAAAGVRHACGEVMTVLDR